MVKVILVDKNARVKETLVKNFQEENLYKKCNFRNANNFGRVNTFELTFEGKKIYISVYAKNSGRANTDNKYELPPPIDKELYFKSYYREDVSLFIVNELAKIIKHNNCLDIGSYNGSLALLMAESLDEGGGR